MRVELNYGKGRLAVEVEDARVAAVLRKQRSQAISNPCQALLESLDHPIGLEPLSTLCAPGKTACVVTSDLTRPVPNQVILPVLLGYMEAHGVRRDDVTVLVATGMHRPAGHEELVELLGPELMSGYRVVNHKPDSEETLEHLGFTAAGTSIKVNKSYAAADLKVLTGLIEPHFMAGYSGGRKSICPGISGMESLAYCHGVDCLAHAAATNCSLKGNPFHEEALEVARAAGCDFILNVVVDEDRNLTGVFAGEMEAAHQAGCELVDRIFKARLERPGEIALTSSAGYPLDIDFYQTVKGLYGALPAVKKGGTIIIASRCPEGIGSEQFLELLKELAAGSPKAFLRDHRKKFTRDQWEVQKLLQVLARARFMVFSEGLTREEVELAGGEKVGSLEAALETAFARHGPNSQAVIIPEGPYVVPEIKRQPAGGGGKS